MRVIETLHEYRFAGYAIRFWQDEPTLANAYENRSRDALAEWFEKRAPVRLTLSGIAEFLASLEYCNAVQVKSDRATVLVYPDWP